MQNPAKTPLSMKKTILFAIFAAGISAHALPTYEPFTEFYNIIATSGSNMVAIAANGVALGTNASGQVNNCVDPGHRRLHGSGRGGLDQCCVHWHGWHKYSRGGHCRHQQLLHIHCLGLEQPSAVHVSRIPGHRGRDYELP